MEEFALVQLVSPSFLTEMVVNKMFPQSAVTHSLRLEPQEEDVSPAQSMRSQLVECVQEHNVPTIIGQVQMVTAIHAPKVQSVPLMEHSANGLTEPSYLKRNN